MKNKRLVSDHEAIANFRKDNVAVARGANSVTLVHSRGIWGHVVYCAFLSYSRADRAFAEWLHAALESYKIPRELVGRAKRTGAVPRSLRPIFRDISDFPAGGMLVDRIREAIADSAALIVVCSPAAAKSTYVNGEIGAFKSRDGAGPILPIICDGVPDDPERECFPPALRYRTGPDGAPTAVREELLAADARNIGDGRELAKIKLIAGLIGVPLDELVQREKVAARRRQRRLALLAGAMAVLAICASIGAWLAADGKSRADASLMQGLGATDVLIGDIAEGMRDFRSVPTERVEAVLAKAERLLDSFGGDTPAGNLLAQTQQRVADAFFRPNVAEVRWHQGRAMNALSLSYLRLGRSEQAMANVTCAIRLFDALAKDPRAAGIASGDAIRLQLLRARTSRGDVLRGTGDLTAAADVFVGVGEMGAADPVPEMRVAASKALRKAGEVLGLRGDWGGAGVQFARAAAILQALVDSGATAPPQEVIRQDLADVRVDLGDALVAGAPAAAVPEDAVKALAQYQEAAAILAALLAASPDNKIWASILAAARLKEGEVLAVLGDRSRSEAAAAAALELIKGVAAADPRNDEAQRALARYYRALARSRLHLQDPAGALAFFQEISALANRQVQLPDASDSLWRRSRADSRAEQGRILLTLGRSEEALPLLRESLAELTALVPCAEARDREQMRIAASGVQSLIKTLAGENGLVTSSLGGAAEVCAAPQARAGSPQPVSASVRCPM